MRWVKLISLALVAAICGYWIYTGLTTPGLKPVIISVYAPPIIEPTEETHDLGEIPTDDKVTHTFQIYNMGGRPLIVDHVDTTCGCTVADMSEKTVKPGDFTELTVELDTSIKLGRVRKKITVFSNDPEHPEKNLFLVGKVLPNMASHGAMEVKDPLVLFKGSCAECHVKKGIGKSGKSLFQADCAMCHGINAQGGVAMNLLKGRYDEAEHVQYIRGVIANGSPNTPTMPPFSEVHGGPLNQAQIDSLVNFLRYQSSLYHDGKLDEEGELLDPPEEE